MEIQINRVELLNELVPMQGIVERRTTIPILSHLLLRVVNERLEISATDLEVSLTSFCEGEVEEEGAIAIQAKKLVEIIRASEGEDVLLRIESEGVLKILIGKSRFKVRGLPAEDFPSLPSIEDNDPVVVSFTKFKNMIGKIFYAISSEDSRFQLSGALFQQREGFLALVATDGHRLALVESDVEGLSEADGILVPRKVLQELHRFESPLDLECRKSENHLSFKIGNRRLICRILEGTFPDYERVIATNNDKVVTTDRRHLASVIHRVSLLTGDRSRAIRLELKTGHLIFSATNPDLGEATEELSCDYDGADLQVGVNPDYIAQFLGAAETDRVRLELKDENSQCVVLPVDSQDKRYVCVIMPIRL